MTSPKPHQERSRIGPAAAAVALSFVLALLLDQLVTACGGDAPASAAIAAACVVSALVCSWRRGALRTVSVALLAWAPCIFVGASVAIATPLAAGEGPRCGNGIMGLLFVGVCLVPFVFGAFLGIAALLGTRRLRFASIMIALVVTVIAIGLLGASLRRFPNPEPDATIGSLRVAATALRAPTAWIALSAAGCAGAVVALALGALALRRARVWRAARPGTHDGRGWVSFEDGAPPLHLAAAGRLPMGDVLVGPAARAAAHYREHGGLLEDSCVAPGTLWDMEDAGRARAAGLAAFAILLIAVTVAPLLAAASRGLVG